MGLLATYLRDHLAGSMTGLELAKRTSGANRENPFGPPLAQLHAEIAEDRETLLDVMRRLGVRRDPLKEGLAWSAEKAGRLKLNGRVVGYSPLSRMTELEGLAMAVTGKRALWRTLAETRAADPRLAGIDLAALAARAEAQRGRIDELRARAAALAFGDGKSSALP